MALVTLPDVSVARAQQEPAHKPEIFTCKPVPEAVVSLAIGSRYVSGSTTRSQISEQSNDEVNQALKPVESYINDLSDMTNLALVSDADSDARAECALVWLDGWATGKALTELDSLNARLAYSPRLAGFALAYLQVQPWASANPERARRIEAWLRQGADTVINFFETEAGPMAKANNQRAWATLAVAAVARIDDDETRLTWASSSFEAVVCTADSTGAMPEEMKRGERALHYQLHALAPLTVALGLLDPLDEKRQQLCSDQFVNIARFALDGVISPATIENQVGKAQVFASGDKTLEPYQMAWAEPFLKRFTLAGLDAFVAPLRPLSYSKLGGNLTGLYAPGNVHVPQYIAQEVVDTGLGAVKSTSN